MNSAAPLKYLCMLLLASGLLVTAFPLTGKVLDEGGVGIGGAQITLANAALSDTSLDDGSWTINVASGIKSAFRKRAAPAPQFRGTALHFIVTDAAAPVKVGIYSVNGRLLYRAVSTTLAAGFYRFDPLSKTLSPNIYAVRIQIGSEITTLKLPVVQLRQQNSSLRSEGAPRSSNRLEKRLVTIDMVTVAKAGYAAGTATISSYDDTVTIILKALAPAYYRDPPSPCHNQFYVDKCIPGDAASACGGNCRVANSCSPPEDASKADLPKTFICPRFMLFSTEMRQAAKDDAALYGWDDSDPPFNYAVVGHDPDVGGVDDQQSSCCQCYQIVYVKPEPSSPQPPELPYPKPLIVQSFNTAASGPKGFDVFMGAGGYGAFNSCYNDAAFSNTTHFNEFIYDEYPWQNPGGGGISFLRYPDECMSGWPPTLAGVQSDACQKKIEGLCNQALVKSSTLITEDTRYSCIQTNKVASLYHQNWEVMVKRVRCPDNLTRVTGCRLKEPALPLPFPEVQTPDDAKKNGTFRDGYHTTTMQDCCKPTCAWADWTVGQKLPVDGEWNSFYSCDKNGVPITK